MAPHVSAMLASVLILCYWTSPVASTNIDLQWAICDKDAATVLDKLGHPSKSPHKAHYITYYDTWPPVYTPRGLAFRRKVKKHQPISMIKARFDEETENVPPEVNCVWDQYGEATYFTCALPSPLGNETTDIWSEDQINFAERYQEVNWEALVPYGPFLNPKWKLHILGYKAVFDDVMAEVTGSPLHLMEIEIETDALESDEIYKNITEHLQAHGVVICDEPQLPKTLRLFEAIDFSSEAASQEQVVLGTS